MTTQTTPDDAETDLLADDMAVIANKVMNPLLSGSLSRYFRKVAAT